MIVKRYYFLISKLCKLIISIIIESKFKATNNFQLTYDIKILNFLIYTYITD